MEDAVSRLRRELFERWTPKNDSDLLWQCWLTAWQACENKFQNAEARDA